MRSPLLALLFSTTACSIVVDDANDGRNHLIGTPPEDAGSDSAPPSSTGGACFEGAADPPFITPREPSMSKDAACGATGTRKDTYASVDEVLALMVGTWVPCGATSSWFLSHPGIVIGGDRTFRFLEVKDGALVPTAILGRVTVWDNGGGHYQINIDRPEGGNILQVTQVGAGDRIDVSETGGNATLARIAPGAAAINTIYEDSGSCSLVGVWDSSSGAGTGTFAFDGKGHFQGTTLGADVCAPTIKGTYELVGDRFEIKTADGMGCPTLYSARWTATFSTDCRTANLKMHSDACTGGRKYIAYDTILTKK